MKLSKNFNDRNLDGIFKLILLIYRKKYEKICVKIYVGYFKELRDIVNQTKYRFLQQVQKTELIN